MKKLLVFIIISYIFIGCSNWNKREEIIVSPKEVINAIEIDNSFLLNTFFAQGFSVVYKDPTGKSLLVKALENNSLQALDMILSRGAYLEEDIDGQTPIFYTRSLEALKKMVLAGGDINKKNRDGETLLTYFIKNKPLSYSYYLVESGANTNNVEDSGWTPTFYAVTSNDLVLIDKIKEKGGDFNFRDSLGNFPIFYSNNQEMLLKLLDITTYDLNTTNKKGENILGEIYLRAVAYNYINVVEKLLTLGVNPYYMSYGDSAFSIATDTDNKDMIDYLKKKGIY